MREVIVPELRRRKAIPQRFVLSSERFSVRVPPLREKRDDDSFALRSEECETNEQAHHEHSAANHGQDDAMGLARKYQGAGEFCRALRHSEPAIKPGGPGE